MRGNFAVRQATRLGRQGRQWSWKGKRKEQKQCRPETRAAEAPLKTAETTTQRTNQVLPRSIKVTVALSDSGESVRSVRSLHNEPQQGQANLSALEPRRVHVVPGFARRMPNLEAHRAGVVCTVRPSRGCRRRRSADFRATRGSRAREVTRARREQGRGNVEYGNGRQAFAWYGMAVPRGMATRQETNNSM